MAMLTEEDLSRLESDIGYKFKNKALLLQAVTHSSFANEQRINKKPDYERLEFLGDAVLETVTSAYLYRAYPDKKEGELTRLRAALVCEPALYYCSRTIRLSDYILLGRGDEAIGGRQKESIVSDVMEAVIGAIYLDSGIKDCTNCLLPHRHKSYSLIVSRFMNIVEAMKKIELSREEKTPSKAESGK